MPLKLQWRQSINHLHNLVCICHQHIPDQVADELAIDLKQYDQEIPYKLYLIYDLENGYYNFHAEVGDEDRIADLLLDEGEGEEL